MSAFIENLKAQVSQYEAHSVTIAEIRKFIAWYEGGTGDTDELKQEAEQTANATLAAEATEAAA